MVVPDEGMDGMHIYAWSSLAQKDPPLRQAGFSVSCPEATVVKHVNYALRFPGLTNVQRLHLFPEQCGAQSESAR